MSACWHLLARWTTVNNALGGYIGEKRKEKGSWPKLTCVVPYEQFRFRRSANSSPSFQTCKGCLVGIKLLPLPTNVLNFYRDRRAKFWKNNKEYRIAVLKKMLHLLNIQWPYNITKRRSKGFKPNFKPTNSCLTAHKKIIQVRKKIESDQTEEKRTRPLLITTCSIADVARFRIMICRPLTTDGYTKGLAHATYRKMINWILVWKHTHFVYCPD